MAWLIVVAVVAALALSAEWPWLRAEYMQRFLARQMPHLGPGEVLLWVRLVRRTVHVLIYGLLTALTLWAAGVGRRMGTIERGVLALGVACLAAVADEVHQSRVPGRSSEMTDVLWDLLGAAITVSLFFLRETVRAVVRWVRHR